MEKNYNIYNFTREEFNKQIIDELNKLIMTNSNHTVSSLEVEKALFQLAFKLEAKRTAFSVREFIDKHSSENCIYHFSIKYRDVVRDLEFKNIKEFEEMYNSKLLDNYIVTNVRINFYDDGPVSKIKHFFLDVTHKNVLFSENNLL